ncbi:MAG: hypothetical protein K2X95_13065 [Flavobacteriaceae bacterium]|nr:hypothetical protein [Flavobacteriaceae bacterium]
MKLTAEQIGYVSNYIQSFDIKWYELQVELTDHFVSIMEEIWNEDKELTFHQVKYRAEQRFGRNYFKEIEQERRKILQKEFNRSQRKMVSEYLKFPKIVMSILMVVVVYQVSFYFEDSSKFLKFISLFFACSALISFINLLRFWRINGERFLSVEMAISMNNVGLMGFMGMIMLTKEYLPKPFFTQTPFFLIILSSLFVLGVLFIITGFYITNKVVSNIKKQYQLT